MAFIRDLASDFKKDNDRWENPDIPYYLSALAAWTEDMEGYFRNVSEQPPLEPTWRLVALMLGAAVGYE